MTTGPSRVAVVGSGVAGLSAALELARAGNRSNVLLLTRGALGGQSASSLAQGGVAAALDDSDSPDLHAQDTEAAGGGLARGDLIQILTRDGPERVLALIRLGARFDRTPTGELALGLEGAHSRPRILHARGDRTGAEVIRALREAVRSEPLIRIVEQSEALELDIVEGVLRGLVAKDHATHEVRRYSASAVLLATGGPGRAYLRTTAPPGLNGDGIAIAARAGARLADLEFVQFHPTALDVQTDPLPLVTEALRGAGALLVDERGRRVVDPAEGGELASRDRVARALWNHLRKGGLVLLDARTRPGHRIAEEFPGVYALCRRHGIDPRTEPIPVTPAAHYHMGGVDTDGEGRTTVAGLWAVGEVAASGLHGANRLASNSLLEGLVFGPRAARSILRSLPSLPSPISDTRTGDMARSHVAGDEGGELPPETVLRIRTILWEHVGLEREKAGLSGALEELDTMEVELGNRHPDSARNLLLVARLITRAALLREESLGSHYRSDFPLPKEGPPRRSFMELAPRGSGDDGASPVRPARVPG